MTRFLAYRFWLRLWKEFSGQVFPCGIGSFDECNFFFAREVLQVFLAGDGVVDVLETLVIDEAVDFVFCCKAIVSAFEMFAEAAGKTVRDTDVKSTGAAGEDVDVILMV
jgi:hypothetical protein